MFDLRGSSVIDKRALIGTCVRLPLSVDAGRLRTEIESLPASAWGSARGRSVPQTQADALFLRGYAPAAGDLPIGDRPVLAHLPYARELIHELIDERALRCLIARLPPRAWIGPHVDQGAYFSKTVRLHLPVTSHDRAYMHCDGETFVMQPGEVWAINNSASHAAWNAHDSLPRMHLVCDFAPSARLLDLLRSGERGRGRLEPEVDAFLAGLEPDELPQAARA
jgi:hypothetical protein